MAPRAFHGDLSPILLQREPRRGRARWRRCAPSSAARLRFVYGPELREKLARRRGPGARLGGALCFAGAEVALLTPRRVPLVFSTAQTCSSATRRPSRSSSASSCTAPRVGWPGARRCGTRSRRAAAIRCGPALHPHGRGCGALPSGHGGGRGLPARPGWMQEGPPVVGFLGRFVPEKGLASAEDALEHLRTPWRALFVGGGPLEVELRAWAERQGDRVRVVTGVKHAEVPRRSTPWTCSARRARRRPCGRSSSAGCWRRPSRAACPCASDSGEIPHTVGDAGRVLPEADAAPGPPRSRS